MSFLNDLLESWGECVVCRWGTLVKYAYDYNE
jgi:hypothetical protein